VEYVTGLRLNPAALTPFTTAGRSVQTFNGPTGNRGDSKGRRREMELCVGKVPAASTERPSFRKDRVFVN